MTESISERRERAKYAKNLTAELKRNDPQEYARNLHLAGVIPGGYRAPCVLHVKHYVDLQPAPSTAEIKARIANPESEVRKFYNTQGNADPNYDLARLARENPAAYESVRLAAMSYGIIERSETRPHRRPVDADPQGSTNPIVLGERLGKLANLPPTTEVSKETLFDLLDHANAVDAAKEGKS
jgi:hypothetical protein